MKREKITGLHMIMAANQKGGCSKSTTIAETAAGLRQLGVTTIVVNLEMTHTNKETSNQRLRRMLRGSNVIDVDCENNDTVEATFGAVLDVAEKDGAVILLDIPGAMMVSGNRIWDNLLSSTYLAELDSFTLFGAVCNIKDHFETALHTTNAVEHPNKYIMYRGWNNPAHNVKLEDMSAWKQVSDAYPSIVMPTRHDSMEAVFSGDEPFTDVPGLILLPEWYKKNGLNRPRPLRTPVERVVHTIDYMADFLKENYLPIICDADDDSGRTTD